MKLSDKIRLTLQERSFHPESDVPSDDHLETWSRQAEQMEEKLAAVHIDAERLDECPSSSI